MHLFLIHESDFNTFAHLHPVRRDSFSFENVVPPLRAGSYLLYAELTHENGVNDTLAGNVVLPAPQGRAPQLAGGTNKEVLCQSAIGSGTNSSQPFALDMDDSWHQSPSAPPFASKTSRLMNGYNMTWLNKGPIIQDRELSL